jgi:uncharacterized MAPEG superfamily protein
MSRDLCWLTYTLCSTLLFWLPYVLNRMVVRGIGGTIANPRSDDAPLAPWAQRAKAAHANAIENLAVFAPAVLAVHVLGLANGATAFAAALYFWSRLAHFVVYTAGVPLARTLAFTGGWVATLILVVRLARSM